MFDELNNKVVKANVRSLEETIDDKMKERSQLKSTVLFTKTDELTEYAEKKEAKLRKCNRQQEHEKKRRLNIGLVSKTDQNSVYNDKSSTIDPNVIEYCKNFSPVETDFNKYVNCILNSNDLQEQYCSFVSIRKLTCLGTYLLIYSEKIIVLALNTWVIISVNSFLVW